MKYYTALFILLFAIQLQSQNIWQFPEPLVAAGNYSITDTVFMSPAGNDTNSGTMNSPVATFLKALQLLPFGTQGVNGGHAYGLVLLLPGTYVVSNGFQQPTGQYEQGNTYKNVSLEGIGDVTIQGRQDTFANGHLIRLMGSHIFIKNLKLKYGKIHGVYFSNQTPRINNILVDAVSVDSVMSFSMLFQDVDTILIRNSKGLHSSRPGLDTLTSPCQWPSGIKFYGCKWAIIHDSEVAYTRGEGLNFHNSEYGLAYNNLLHDNSSNIYCDNSARIVIRNNLNYATPGKEVYWRTCPSDTIPLYGSNGILLANEGACSNGGPTYQFCQSYCPFDNRSYPHIDSIFIFNNFFVNTTSALNLWQGNVDLIIAGYNCVRNVFFHHNTIIGVTGDSTAGNAAMIYAYFPNAYNTVLNRGFSIAENINIHGNIISYDVMKYGGIQPIRVVRDATFPVPFELNVSNNRVIEFDDEFTSTDQVDTALIASVDPAIDSIIKYLQPCPENANLIQPVSLADWIDSDYSYTIRLDTTNVGALEYVEQCSIDTTPASTFSTKSLKFNIYPNPAENQLICMREGMLESASLACVDLTGKRHFNIDWPTDKSSIVISVNHLTAGLYFLYYQYQGQTLRSLKFIKV